MRVASGASLKAPVSTTGNVSTVRPLLSRVVLRSQSDERLVVLARDGHDQAFVAIAERYRRELLAHARRVVPGDRAEDVVQQAMLSAFSALRGHADVLDVRAWLHRIVHNAALGVVRRGEDHDELRESLAMGAGTQGEAERRLDARDALIALAALPDHQRQALELTALQGRSGREAARTLDISESALRQLVHRARGTLRAGATALTPMPLLSWAAGGADEHVAARLTELFAGAGLAATATKVCATIAVTATLMGGASQVLPVGHERSSAHVPAPAAQRGGLDRRTFAETAVAGTVRLAGASRPRVDRLLSGRHQTTVQVAVGVGQHGQQQQSASGNSTGDAGRSHQTGLNRQPAGQRSAGPGASGAAGPQGTLNTTGARGASGATHTGSQGATASGANQP